MTNEKSWDELGEAMEKLLDNLREAVPSHRVRAMALYRLSENLDRLVHRVRLEGMEGANDADVAIFEKIETAAVQLRRAKEIYFGVRADSRKEYRQEGKTPWDVRCASFVAHFFPKEDREAWLGDLHEARHDLITSGYRPWLVPLITFGRILFLGWAAFRIKYEDLVSSKKKQTERK